MIISSRPTRSSGIGLPRPGKPPAAWVRITPAHYLYTPEFS
nr:MAG TPA: hypothetical protein [Caudoviricetes sp.]